jgi:hypothetical protein
MTTDMKIKNICPVIGMISSEKSTILNTLFNMDYLEASPDVTTKIINLNLQKIVIRIKIFCNLYKNKFNWKLFCNSNNKKIMNESRNNY